VLACGILGGSHSPWALPLLVLGEGSGWRLAGLYASHLWEKIKKLYVMGDSRCVMIPTWGTLSGTYVWCWRSVEYTSCLLVLVFVTVVLDTVCSPGTFMYCI